MCRKLRGAGRRRPGRQAHDSLAMKRKEGTPILGTKSSVSQPVWIKADLTDLDFEGLMRAILEAVAQVGNDLLGKSCGPSIAGLAGASRIGG